MFAKVNHGKPKKRFPLLMSSFQTSVLLFEEFLTMCECFIFYHISSKSYCHGQSNSILFRWAFKERMSQSYCPRLYFIDINEKNTFKKKKGGEVLYAYLYQMIELGHMSAHVILLGRIIENENASNSSD